jgi:hypothetical protein
MFKTVINNVAINIFWIDTINSAAKNIGQNDMTGCFWPIVLKKSVFAEFRPI